jgi:murein DD-endopeptidase MepM/ murein hydrolase activator NlpD
MYWPLKNAAHLFPDSIGRYGAERSTDIHTGIDLYCELGQEVVAIEDGQVRLIEGFTGPNAADPSPWWNDTSAILIYGKTGVINYGEVTPLVKQGDYVIAGQTIAVIDTSVLKSFKGRPMVMLHLELMTHDSEGTVWWNLGESKPEVLCDPEPMLLSISDKVIYFDINDYDGKSYTDPKAPVKPSKWFSLWEK